MPPPAPGHQHQDGKTSPETITAVEVNHDTDLYDLKVKTPHGTQVIHTTSSHLFWDPYLKQWAAAAKLKKGELLKTADGCILRLRCLRKGLAER